jgi:predicted amidohydrolase
MNHSLRSSLRRFVIAASLLTWTVLTSSSGMAQPAAAPPRTLTVAAVQTRLQFSERPEQFTEHMTRRLAEAMKHRPELVVLPEDIGTPLVAIGETETFRDAANLSDALQRMLTRHQAEVAKICQLRNVSPVRALWLLKAEEIRRVYESTFSSLARKHQVHIAAGSVPLVLPDRPGDVFNAGCIFSPDGKMHVVALKVNLTRLERPDSLDFSAGARQDQRIYRLPSATIGVLVCADAWHGELAEQLVDQGAELLIQVSANPEIWTAGHPKGWRESLYKQVQRLNVYGVVCMGVGRLFEVPFQGQSQILAPIAWTTDGSGVLKEADTATEEAVIAVRLDFGMVSP